MAFYRIRVLCSGVPRLLESVPKILRDRLHGARPRQASFADRFREVREVGRETGYKVGFFIGQGMERSFVGLEWHLDDPPDPHETP